MSLTLTPGVRYLLARRLESLDPDRCPSCGQPRTSLPPIFAGRACRNRAHLEPGSRWSARDALRRVRLKRAIRRVLATPLHHRRRLPE